MNGIGREHTQPFNELSFEIMKTANGSLRQAIFIGLRDDKDPKDCIIE